MNQKLNRLFLSFAAIAGMGISAISSAAEPGSGANPYSECGIGAAIFGDLGWAAASSNVIWDLVITAVVSAVSSPQTCSEKKQATARLILETLPSLEKELSIGRGEHLLALQRTMGCAPEKTGTLNKTLRAAYASDLMSPSYSEKSRVERASSFYAQVVDVLEQSPGACTANL